MRGTRLISERVSSEKVSATVAIERRVLQQLGCLVAACVMCALAMAPAWAVAPPSPEGRLLSAVPADAKSMPMRAATKGTLDVLDGCIRRLDPTVDIGYARVALLCPDLARRLEESGWAAWLPRDWSEAGNDLSQDGLKALRAAITTELARPTSARGLDPERLRERAKRLASAAPASQGAWARFRNWLRDLLESAPDDNEESALARMAGDVGLSQAILEALAYPTLALAVIVALGILIQELLAMRGLRRLQGMRNASLEVAAEPRGLTWRDVETAPILHKPRLLVELIATRLWAQSRLPVSARSLTTEELTKQARLENDADAISFRGLALLAERVRYSSGEVPAREIESALEQGRALLESLESRVR